MSDCHHVLAALLEFLPRYAYRLASEQLVQDGIAEILGRHALRFDREHVAGADRFDFLCDAGVVIEVKTAGSLSEALRQAERYCRNPIVRGVLIATTRRWRGAAAPEAFHGKPVYVCTLQGRGLL